VTLCSPNRSTDRIDDLSVRVGSELAKVAKSRPINLLIGDYGRADNDRRFSVSLERLLISLFDKFARQTIDRPAHRPPSFLSSFRLTIRVIMPADSRDINLSRADRWNSLETFDSASLDSLRFARGMPRKKCLSRGTFVNRGSRIDRDGKKTTRLQKTFAWRIVISSRPSHSMHSFNLPFDLPDDEQLRAAPIVYLARRSIRPSDSLNLVCLSSPREDHARFTLAPEKRATSSTARLCRSGMMRNDFSEGTQNWS